jgi:hypothetical protein
VDIPYGSRQAILTKDLVIRNAPNRFFPLLTQEQKGIAALWLLNCIYMQKLMSFPSVVMKYETWVWTRKSACAGNVIFFFFVFVFALPF